MRVAAAAAVAGAVTLLDGEGGDGYVEMGYIVEMVVYIYIVISLMSIYIGV